MRALLSLLVCVHLVAMAASALRNLPPGAALREWTRPYERTLGVHQTWPMFGSPPRSTRWLVFHGLTDDGQLVDLPQLLAPPDPESVIWRYQRRNKFLRNATADKRKYLRAAMVRWHCRQGQQAGLDLRQIHIERFTVRTPSPFTDHGPRATWPVHSEIIERWNCRR